MQFFSSIYPSPLLHRVDGADNRLPRTLMKVLLLVVLFSNVAFIVAFVTAKPSASIWQKITWNRDRQGKFLLALCSDRQGSVWVGTEDDGVWRYEPRTKQWRQFTIKDGLGDDNAYSIACDQQGRVWVGHLNHGVSVFDGRQWKNYDVLNGPLGEHVLDIAVCPTNGDVWMATNCGLTRYRIKSGTWDYYTRLNSLPTNQIQAITFSAQGALLCGTLSDGLLLAGSQDDYKQWKHIDGPLQPGNSPIGKGLPSALINDVLISSEDVFYAATTCGLARSVDKGISWNYVRGADWADKVRGKYYGQSTRVWGRAWRPASGARLSEDRVTSLAQDRAGNLWVGHWRGYEVFNMKSGERLLLSQGANEVEDANDFVTAILPLPDSPPLIARYGSGLVQSQAAWSLPSETPAQSADTGPGSGLGARELRPTLPEPAQPPSLVSINKMRKQLYTASLLVPEQGPIVSVLDDDWRTQGNWLGRYGRYWACLASMGNSPRNLIWGAAPGRIPYYARIGPNCDPGDSLRYFVHWLYTTNPRSLEMPPTYFQGRISKKLTTPEFYRRQSEMDDHGETYPMTKDGPDIYFAMRIPAGLFYLSLYDMNKDGHSDDNRYRDYRVAIYEHPVNNWLRDITGLERQPVLARGRIRDFWGGVYKRYLVQGPRTLTIHVSRNHSFNTILPAVMLDLVDEKPPPYFQTMEQWKLSQIETEKKRQLWKIKQATGQSKEPGRLQNATPDARPAVENDPFNPATNEAVAADKLFREMDSVRFVNASWWAAASRQYYLSLLRWYLREKSLKAREQTLGKLAEIESQERFARLATCYYHVGYYEEWEASQELAGLKSARRIEKSLRWDGTGDDNGNGYAVVSAYLNAQSKEVGTKAKSLVSRQPGSTP